MTFFKRLLLGIVRSRMGLSVGSASKSAARSMGNSISKAGHEAEGYWKKLGPGLTTGAADDDPSGIATYSQVGAQYGNMFGWMAIFTYPLMSVVQFMCAKIGLVTSRGLAANIRLHYPRWILYALTVLLFAANTFNIGADLGAMAEAARLIAPNASFIWLVVGFTMFSLLLQIFTSYKTYASYLKWLALILFAYIFTAFAVHLDWGAILYSAFVPHMVFDKAHLLIVAAVLGTTISPYLFFWQTSQEVEEKILHGEMIEEIFDVKNTVTQTEGIKTVIQVQTEPVPVIATIPAGEIKDMRIDVWSGMFISNLVMFFIIIVCSATLFKNGITDIKTAADAANALRPLAGQGAYLLFAVGIVGTGLLAVPILAGSISYALAESFRWVSGLHHRLREAYAFYAVIVISMLVGLGLNFVGLDPIKALIYSAVANCIVAPIVLIFIVALSSRKDVMGEYANGKWTKVVGWGVTVLMGVVAVGTIVAMVV
jgi:NRAMP (natural resistance-associated macrophage protein)-like metal ion transporter